MTGVGLILTLGKSTEHVKTSLLNYSPNHIILLTSEQFASTARRQLSHWKRQFDLEGDVFVIADLFTNEAAENIMTQTMLAIHYLKTAELDTILLGITGGTMHMAAVAASAATIADIPVFYVKQPDGEQVIQPRKDIIEMPTMSAFTKLSNIPIEALDFFNSMFTEKEGDEKGRITKSEAEIFGMPRGFLNYLTMHRVLDQIDKSTYEFTYTGISMIRLLHANPNISSLLKAKTEKENLPDHMFV
jgi:hypothetical protein